MNSRPLATGITFLAGAGGSGRTSTALGLAAKLARAGHKTLFFDLCLGWGGLNITDTVPRSFEQFIETVNVEELPQKTDFGFDLVTCAPPRRLDPAPEEFAKLTFLIHELGARYDFVILDPPASAHPLSLMAAGLCEVIYLQIRPDASSVASAYCLLKTLSDEEIDERIRISFAFVNSEEEASSLKSRFDQLTERFLGKRFTEGGFIYRENISGEGIFRPDQDFEICSHNAKNLITDDSFLLRNVTTEQVDVYQESA